VEQARLLLATGRGEEAAAAAARALQLDSGALGARWVLASVAEWRGAWSDAREELRALLAAMPAEHPDADTIRERLAELERRLEGSGTR
jgi:cytochrome c-type biogenesis protein CcmH/NrfG